MEIPRACLVELYFAPPENKESERIREHVAADDADPADRVSVQRPFFRENIRESFKENEEGKRQDPHTWS